MAETTDTPRAPKKAADAADELKRALIKLILDDPDILDALKLTLGLPISQTDSPGLLGSDDAEHAANLQMLIEQAILKHIRPDALRRPGALVS